MQSLSCLKFIRALMLTLKSKLIIFIHICLVLLYYSSCSAVSLVNELITHPLVFGIVFSNVILGENSFNETSLRAGNEIILSVDYCGLHLLTVESKAIIYY